MILAVGLEPLRSPGRVPSASFSCIDLFIHTLWCGRQVGDRHSRETFRYESQRYLGRIMQSQAVSGTRNPHSPGIAFEKTHSGCRCLACISRGRVADHLRVLIDRGTHGNRESVGQAGDGQSTAASTAAASRAEYRAAEARTGRGRMSTVRREGGPGEV